MESIIKKFEKDIFKDITWSFYHITGVAIDLVGKILRNIEDENKYLKDEVILNKYSEIVNSYTLKDLEQYTDDLRGYNGAKERTEILVILKFFTKWINDNSASFKIFHTNEFKIIQQSWFTKREM